MQPLFSLLQNKVPKTTQKHFWVTVAKQVFPRNRLSLTVAIQNIVIQ